MHVPTRGVARPQLLITTMLTLGYGDVVPSTDGGRLFTLLGAISGALLTAITVALTKDHLGLSRSEAKVVSFLKKDANRKRVQHAGAATIQAVYRYYLTKIKWKHHGHANPDAALNKVFRVLEKCVRRARVCACVCACCNSCCCGCVPELWLPCISGTRRVSRGEGMVL